jgi:hypothetical protein
LGTDSPPDSSFDSVEAGFKAEEVTPQPEAGNYMKSAVKFEEKGK